MFRYCLSYSLIILSMSLYAQQPPTINFSNVDVNWSYLSKDSTFIQSPEDPFSSPYWGFYSLDYEIEGNDLYILEFINSQSPNGGLEGSLLHKLDVSSGEKQWINHNSSYTGNLFREGFGKSSLVVSDDEKIHLIGNRSIDTLFTSFSLLGFNSKPIEITIDKETGETKSKITSAQHDSDYYTFYDLSNRIVHTNHRGYISISSRIIDEDGVVQNTMEFRVLDDSLKIVSDPFFTLETPYLLPGNQLYRQPLYEFLSEDEIIVLFSNTNPNTNAYENITLSWLDFSQDIDKIETQRIDVTDQLAYPQHPQNEIILVFGEGKDVFIEQEFFDENGEKYNWISWYHDMEWYGRIPFALQEDGLNYDQILYIKSEDDKAYFIARALNEFDVLMWKKGEEDFTVIKTIVPEVSTDYLRVYLETIFTIPHEKFMLSVGIDKLNENGKQTNFSYYYSIDQNQLLIPTSTKDLNSSKEFTVFPNPSIGMFFIEHSTEICGNMSIYNALGEMVASQTFVTDSYVVDLSDKPNGIYLIKIETCSGKIKESKVIVSR